MNNHESHHDGEKPEHKARFASWLEDVLKGVLRRLKQLGDDRIVLKPAMECGRRVGRGVHVSMPMLMPMRRSEIDIRILGVGVLARVIEVFGVVRVRAGGCVARVVF